MSDKMREEFEEWFLKSGLTKFKETAWMSWQASRAALVVELPSALSAPPYASYEGGWNDMREEAQDAIHAAGAKSK